MRVNQAHDNLITFGEASHQGLESYTYEGVIVDPDGRKGQNYLDTNTKGDRSYHNTVENVEGTIINLAENWEH